MLQILGRKFLKLILNQNLIIINFKSVKSGQLSSCYFEGFIILKENGLGGWVWGVGDKGENKNRNTNREVHNQKYPSSKSKSTLKCQMEVQLKG